MVPSLPDEIWQLVLAWGGLRTSATAAACSTAFRSLHRTVASTPALLARALLVDHGLPGAAASLYGSPTGYPIDRHAVRSDADIAATLRDLLVLSAPPGAAFSAAAAAGTAAAAVAAELETADGAAAGGAVNAKALADRLAAMAHDIVPLGWARGGMPAFCRQVTGGLLSAAAAAGHVQVTATALALDASERNKALVAASAAGRRRVVRLLLAAGTDANAAEPFGPCALYEAARNGYTDIAEILLGAGARVDGASATAPPDGRLPMPLSFGARRTAVPPLPLANPWQLWPTLGTSSDAAEGGTPQHPLRLRVPVPLAAASSSFLSPRGPVSAGSAAAPALASKASSDVKAFFSDSVFSGGGGARPVRQFDEQPRTPTAAAAACPTAWDSDDDDDDAAQFGARGGPLMPCTPAAKPPPLMPPPLPRRKPTLPLPLPGASRPPLPLMPSLTSASPLPPAMMLMLQGGFHSHGGPSPLLAACRAGHAATAAMLLRRGARADVEGGAELLGAASPDVVDELLAAVSGLAVHLGAALLAASSANRADVVSALLRHGADPAFRGGMVLMEAAFKGNATVLEVLLEAGGGRLRETGALDAAFDLARTWGRAEALKLLAKANASA